MHRTRKNHQADELLRADLEAEGIDSPRVTGLLKLHGWTPPAVDGTAEGYLAAARAEMLERAASRDMIAGERSMGRTVRAYNALYGDRIRERVEAGLPPLTETMGWEFMSVVKKARGALGEYREDDYVDDVAYPALAAEAAWREQQGEPDEPVPDAR